MQFPNLPHSRVRSPDAHGGENVGLLGPIQDPQLYEIEERSPGTDSYETGDYDSQSSTNYPAVEPPRMPHSDYNQAHGPWLSTNYLLGLAPQTDVLQNGEYPGSFESALPQQGYHMVTTPNLGLGDARYHSSSQAPEVEFNTVGHTGRNAQHAPSGTGRRSSMGSRPRLQTSYQEMMQIPSDSEPSAIHMSVSNQQFDQPEAIITRYWDPSLVSLGQPSGNGRTFTTTRDPINPNVSDPLHNSQTSYQGVPQYPRASPLQRQNQGARRGTNDPLLFGQDPFMVPDIMPSLDSHSLARNAHKPPPGATKELLSPNWQPSQQISSSLEHGKRSNLSDIEVRQPQRKRPRKSKRKCCSDSSSPTTPPTTTKRAKRRRYNSKERAEVKEKRRTGACKACHIAKRKACESLPISLSRCHQADCSCSARIRHLGLALPCDISLCRENPLPDLHLPELPLGGLKNE